MDLQSLAVVIHAAMSPNPEERKAAEESLNQYQYTPLHLVRLLQIIVDNHCEMAVRQFASIIFKNFVAKNWSPDEPGESQKISASDKSMVRENILGFIAQVHPLLRVQLGESLKTIINADYPEQWPGLLHWIKCNLQLQDQQVSGALYVHRALSRKYEFKSDEERTPVYLIVNETFPHLLNIFHKLVQIDSPSSEVADLIKLICKIFWSSIYLEVPKQLYDPNIFNAWMVLFLTILERPVPLGQPTDPEIRKGWGWWKVKKWTVHIFNRLYTRFGDLKVQNPECKAFAQMFQKNYAGKVLECHLHLLNAIRAGEYLPDRVINLILQYLNSSISKNSMYQLLLPQLDIILFEIIFPLMCFNDNDQKLWTEDPHEYVRKGYDIIEDLYSPRTAAMDFVSELVRKRGKTNLQKFLQFIVEIFRRYSEASVEFKPYRQKDGALLAIGTLCDKLKQTEPYKSELERMLVQHVFPEFTSPVGHLRSKAAWVSGQYASINFSDQNNFRTALHFVVSGLRDPDLPVRVDSVFALRSFIEACKDLNEIRPILPQLLDEFFKLMNEVENEDLVFTLETIVDKFGEEMAPYAIGLCQNLSAAFWRCINTSEADDEGDDSSALAAAGCLRAISTILESVSRLPHIFVQIEPTLLPILRKMLTTDGQDVFEEVTEIVSYMTFYSPTISLEMWTLWPLMMEALGDWAIDYFENILVPLDNYISRSTAHFLACKDPDYQQSLWNMLSSIMSDKNMEDTDIEPAPKLIEVVFHNCKGQVDQWVEPYLRITIERLRRTEKSYLKCLLMQVIADCLYYNASLTLGVLQNLGVATEVFSLWFQMLQQVKKSGVRANFRREHDKKVCCLGLTSLLTLPEEQLSGEAFGRIFTSRFLIGFIAFVSIGAASALSFSDSLNPTAPKAISDLRDAIVKGFGFQAEGMMVSGFDIRDALVGHSVAYEFDIEIDNKVLPIKLLEDVNRWDLVDFPIFSAEEDKEEGEEKRLAEQVQRPSARVLPVLSPFQLAGPMELWIQDGDDMRLSLPHDVDAGTLKKVILSDGAAVTVKGARSVSLRHPLDLPFPLNRTHRDGRPVASAFLTMAESLRRLSRDAPNPILSLRIVGPTSLASSPSASPADKLKLKRLAPGLVELSSRSSPADDPPASLWPLTSLNGSEPNLRGFEELLSRVMEGREDGEESSFRLVRAEVAARTYLKMGFSVKRLLEGETADWSGFPGWKTRPESMTSHFEVLARVEENGKIVAERIERVQPFAAQETVLASVETGNVSMSNVPIVYPLPSLFAL